MASIEKRNNKGGLSYRIRVFRGTDLDGKKMKASKTWTPPMGMSEKKADKEAEKIAFEFEQSIANGYEADNRQTFQEYAEYVLDLKERSGTKAKTIESYRFLLQRINPEIGSMKLTDIRPQHLNQFYKKLQAEGIRNTAAKATPKDCMIIRQKLKEMKLSHAKAAKMCGMGPATVDAICRGETVTEHSAETLCSALGLDVKKTFRIEKDQEPLSNKSIVKYHGCIRTILTQAEKEMLVPYNAAAKATPPKLMQHEPNYFQPGQVLAIVDALEKEPIKWRTIVHLLIVTGCRRGEIAALKWSKVDFENNKIRIDTTLLYSPDKGIYENTTKTSDTRFLKLPAETMALLKKYRAWYCEYRLKIGDRWKGEADYCFTKEDGTPIIPDSITAWCNKFSEKHQELPHINPHAFRHTVASTLINNGQDIVTVSKRLGHSRTSTTLDIYSHIIAEADADASECLAEILLRKQA